MTTGEPLVVRVRDEAAPDADQAAALGRHRHARAGAGAARAHRLLRRARRRRRGGGDARVRARRRLPRRSSAATTSTTCAPPSTAYERADRVEAARALVFIGFMGAGKTTAARAAAAALGVRASTPTRELEQRLGMPIEDYFAAHGEAAFRERRGGGRRSSCSSAPPAPVDLARRRRGRLRARARRCWRATRSCCSTSTSRHGVAARAAASGRPLARDRERFAALHAERRPLYEALADAVLLDSARDAVRRAVPALRALRGRPPGTKLLWARAASGELPGLRRRRRARRRGFWPLRGRALPGHRRDRRRAATATRIAEAARGARDRRPGEEAQDARDRRARCCAALARGRHGPRRPRGRARRRRGRRPRRLLRGGLPARRAGRAGADDARRAGRLRLRRQDRRRPAGGQELRRRLPPAARPCSPTRATLRDAAAGGARRGLGRGGQDRADRRRAAVGARARAGDGASTATSCSPARARSSRVVAARRARRRPAPGAQPRPHGRPRDRDRRPATRATATARRSGSACSPR